MTKKERIHTVLVADDEEGIRFFLTEALTKEGYHVVAVPDGAAAIEQVKNEAYQVVILDVKMPGLSGFEALEEIRAVDQKIVPIILTAYGSETMAINDLHGGGGSYLTKPVNIEQLRQAVKRACEQYDINEHDEKFDDFKTMHEKYHFEDIIGTSARMMDFKNTIAKVVESDVTVLICGESGTGKELVAKDIHTNSHRKNGPFIGVNCSAIPDTLLESELFGYEKGAFTGAEAAKPGKFELASGGTLFLDEVSDMNLLTQAKLLRVLQEREFERLGGTKQIKVDVRIIAATNKNLAQEVKMKHFREDLYYRINVIPLCLPALCERKEDIPLLLEHLLAHFSEVLRKKIKYVSVEAMEALMNYQWPGNVREFENVLQRAIVLEQAEILTKEHLPTEIQQASSVAHIALQDIDFSRPLGEVTRDVIDIVEKEMIMDALKECGGNRVKAAQMLKISRKSLYNKMAKYGVPETELDV